MPGLNGFDTTARMKAQLPDEFLPIILVTALHDHDSRLKGLRAGADERQQYAIVAAIRPHERDDGDHERHQPAVDRDRHGR